MRYLKFILVGLLFGFGILLGFFIDNFPFISWKKEVKIYEVFQVLATLFIGIAIPLFIKRWVEDNRIIKSLLKEETANLLAESKKINDKFLECYTNKSISSDDKQFILYLFNQLENLLDSFGNNLATSFGLRYNTQYQDLKIAYYIYWKNITGKELMNEAFSEVNLEYVMFQTSEFNKFNKAVRGFVITIQTI